MRHVRSPGFATLGICLAALAAPLALTGCDTGSRTVASATDASADANLSGLTLSTGLLSPAFSSSTTSYSATVANSVSTLTLTPLSASGLATTTVNGVSVGSGAASGSFNLNVGQNTFTVVVTSQNGTVVRPYTVIITRAAV